ncbi:hypothetical protein DRO61_06545 [Candidatus Bathyarchaeota archaeon]|nr:MAG: hypothetical protein DRO61_06545 [Candidatus Bathyarchaeota archaeon]
MNRKKSNKKDSSSIGPESYAKPQITVGKVTVSPSAKSPNQKKYIKAMQDKDIVICEGPAGTGKTHLAIGMGIHFYQKGLVKKVIIARPTVDAGEELGFLPGDIDSKMDPYVRPALDELEDFLSLESINYLRQEHKLEIVPIAYMRGRTFKDAFIVCDECQNLSHKQMKMLLTRIGSGSRMVLTGDTSQSDLKKFERGAFKFAKYLLDKYESSTAITLTKDDIQRHNFVLEIVENWESELENFKNGSKIPDDEDTDPLYNLKKFGFEKTRQTF